MCCDYRKNEIVVTYDPSYVDEHSDSTDFDDMSIKPGKRYHKRRKPLVKKTKAEKEYSITHLNGHYPNMEAQNMSPKKPVKNATTSLCHHCGTSVPNYPGRRTCTKLPEKSSAGVMQGTSKVNLLKKKISSIFFRTNRKVMSPIEENNANNHYKVYCDDCRQRQMRKYSRKQQGYPPRPVYLVEDIPAGPLITQTQAARYHALSRHQYSHTSTLSSNSEVEIWKEKLYRRRKDDELEKEFKKEYLKYKKESEKQLRTRSQQYSRHDKYQVFTNQYCQAENRGSPQMDSSTAFGNGIPVSPSGFWEFFINKFNARYQEAKSLTSAIGCCPPNCGNSLQTSDLKRIKGQQTSECQTQSQHNQFEPSGSQRSKYNYSNTLSPEPSQCRPFMPAEKSYGPLSSLKSNAMLDVACECNPDQICKTQRTKKLAPKSTQALSSDSKFCQEPHDDVTKVLRQKYNGEVLCIHNPPCVLINGCLNVPQQPIKSTPVNVWPAVAAPEKKLGYLSNRKQKKAKKKSSEQACQYHEAYGELQQYASKVEKLIQCICNHNPPCQIVPGCCKPKYDPELVNSCVHVPMCKKIPECLVEPDCNSPSWKCDHKPKCFNVPECRRNFTALTARGNTGTQAVREAGPVCRHKPPCLMIPRCLGRVMCDSVIQYDAIPDCMHRPPCEFIPACCRKAPKDTASTIRPPFNKGVDIKIHRVPVLNQNKPQKMDSYRK